MAKALKIAAVVVGVAALAIVTGGAAVGLGVGLSTSLLGVSAGTLVLASTALSAGAALLTKTPSVPTSQTQRLNASVDPRAFRKDVLGQTAMATDIRYEEWSGKDQDYCDWIVCFASHAIDGIDEVWLNDEMAWSATTGVVGKYVGYFSIPNIVLEGSPANAFTFASGKWNSGSRRLTGCAYARFRFKVTGNSKKAESPFSSGPTSRITVIGRGAKLYDPRRDSTVPGGFGPMRANDQSTWRFTADDGGVIGENLPLLILRRLLGWRITNPVTGAQKLATGCGIPPKRIDMMSFIVAANQADEEVNRSAGGTEPRYHGAGVVSEGDDPKTSFDALCAGCCARFRDTGGKLSIVIPHNDLAAAAADDGLDGDDVIGGFNWDPDPAMEAAPNIIRGRYVDASSASLYQLIDYPEIRIASPDGIDRVFTLDLGFVESPSQAQRIAKQVLQRKQYERRFSAPFDIRAWCWPVGKVVPFTFAPLGFDRTLFRVSEQDIGTGASCAMVLDGESPDIYKWDADDRPPVNAAAAIVYDPTRSPLVQAIDDVSRRAAHMVVRQSIAFPFDTTMDSITIVAFDATIDDTRELRFPAQTIGGLQPGNTYLVLWDLDDSMFVAVPAPGLAAAASSRYVLFRPMTTQNADGTFPPEPTAPGGDGGAGYGGGGCPIVTAKILLADADRTGPGVTIAAGNIEAGSWVWTKHEGSGAWGAHLVTFTRVFESDLLAVGNRPLTSPSHLWWESAGWVRSDVTDKPAGRGKVVALTVAEAHTYVLVDDKGDWLLSHNKRAQEAV